MISEMYISTREKVFLQAQSWYSCLQFHISFVIFPSQQHQCSSQKQKFLRGEKYFRMCIGLFHGQIFAENLQLVTDSTTVMIVLSVLPPTKVHVNVKNANLYRGKINFVSATLVPSISDQIVTKNPQLVTYSKCIQTGAAVILLWTVSYLSYFLLFHITANLKNINFWKRQT